MHNVQKKHVLKNSCNAGPRSDTAVIAIAAGDGIAELFKSLGVHTVISGGQTMNPSTADIVKVIEDSGEKGYYFTEQQQYFHGSRTGSYISGNSSRSC